MKKFIIAEEDANAILNYLANKPLPFGEVAPLIQILQTKLEPLGEDILPTKIPKA